MKSKISIIIPVFNRESIILETLESIENQTFKNWECLIIDDGSSDSTISVIKEFIKNKPNFSLHHRPNNIRKGATSCRNIGFNLSKGDFIQWFDSDDIMHPNMLEEKVNVLLSNPLSEFVVAKMDDLVNGNIIKKEYKLISSNLFFDYIRNKVFFFTPGPLFRKTFLINSLLFDSSLSRHQESEFYFRLILRNSKYLTINKSLALRRIHNDSINSNISEKNDKVYFFILLKKYLESILKLNLNIWNEQLFIYFFRWSKSSIKFFLKYRDISFLFFGIQVLGYSIYINWKAKFQ